jgi:hypothetical protein
MASSCTGHGDCSRRQPPAYRSRILLPTFRGRLPTRSRLSASAGLADACRRAELVARGAPTADVLAAVGVLMGLFRLAGTESGLVLSFPPCRDPDAGQ